MGTPGDGAAPNKKKDGLKRQFALWAIRREDITAALHAWRSFAKLAKDAPQDALTALVILTAFVASYGRVFSGETAYKGLLAGVGGEDKKLHKHLMDLRHQAVAHSDLDYRAIRLIPPGATADGIAPVPAHHVHKWRWLVQAMELRGDHDQVEHWLRTLQRDFEQRADEAFVRLHNECNAQIVPAFVIALADL